MVAERAPRVAIVLGSGLGGLADRMQAAEVLPFAAVPEFPLAATPGHAGRICLGTLASQSALLFCGRIHAYEGLGPQAVLAGVRLMADWGVRRVLLTNAAGGIRSDLVAGSLMVVRAHLDWTRGFPHLLNRDAGPRAPAHDLLPRYAHYSPGLTKRLQEAAQRRGKPVATGTFAAVLGPNYETPAEVRALRWAGADAVGMSTAAEVKEAAALRMDVAAISCIANRAAGLATGKLTHDEVLRTSASAIDHLGELLEAFLSEA
jgi:purine-nucleoside phosphorylase